VRGGLDERNRAGQDRDEQDDIQELLGENPGTRLIFASGCRGDRRRRITGGTQ
jgi:hypothetical protein